MQYVEKRIYDIYILNTLWQRRFPAVNLHYAQIVLAVDK